MSAQLTPTNHDRDSAGMTYVYPVVSRRAGGVSVGVNLNPNNACNWACVYCQVPDLIRGTAPDIDLVQLESELRALLASILHGDFMHTRVPEGARRLNDIALSGNGEPTSAKAFPQIIELIGRVMADFDLVGKIKLVLITNGSLADRPRVQNGLRKMAALNGEVWFKFDSATASGMRSHQPDTHFARQAVRAPGRGRAPVPDLAADLRVRAGRRPAVGRRAGGLSGRGGPHPPAARLPVQGVLLYGLARPSMQPQAKRLSALPADMARGGLPKKSVLQACR